MSAQTPTSGQQTIDGGFRADPPTLVDVSDDSSGQALLLLTECPFCSVEWYDAYRRGKHSLHVVEEHLQARHARPVESKRDDEHHTLGGGA